jgi:DNA polymerase
VRSLVEAAAEAAGCTRCGLAGGRTQVVYGSGRHDADLLFVGEGPGFHEDQQGIPFVGAAGQLLNRMLAEVGIRREDVYIANVVKCRPPGNRDPLPEEITACTPWLEEQLALIDPRVIVTLGNFATRFVLNAQVGITKVRGQRFPVGGRTVIPTFHPAAILRGGGDGSRQFEEFRSDFRQVAAALAEPRDAAAPPAPTAQATPVAAPEQLGLF